MGVRPRPAVLCSRRGSLAASNRRQRPFMKTLSTIFFSLLVILALFASVCFTVWAFRGPVADDQDRHSSLTRRPGPSAFAYSLVIPTLHLLFGLTGHSALLFLIPHSGQAAIPFLSIIPWILDILVPYLTWKAIRFTGIRPDPTRLITAFVVILIYRFLLPALFVLLS